MTAYLIIAAVTLSLLLCLSIIYAVRQAPVRKGNSRNFQHRTFSIVVGAFGTCITLFIIATILILFLDVRMLVFYVPFLVLSLNLLLSAVNWRLELREDCLIYRDRLRRTKRIFYDEIDCFSIQLNHYSQRPMKYVIQIGDSKITVTEDVYHFVNFGRDLTERMHKLGSRRGVIKIHGQTEETVQIGALSDVVPDILSQIFSDLFFG